MRLNGIHHITAITGDAQRNVDFYVGVLGLRLVKKSVNQDDPTVYHLFYGDEHAKPGLDLTFFEYPGAPLGPRRRGHDPPDRLARGRAAALDFWAARLADDGIEAGARRRALRFRDPEGLEHELARPRRHGRAADRRSPGGAGRARAPGLPRRARLRVRSRAQPRAARAGPRLPQRRPGGLGGARREPRRRTSTTSRPPSAASRARAACTTSPGTRPTRTTWRGSRPRPHGAHPTQVIDRHYFKSIYFREPSGVLFELATPSPGFTVDEPLETLGEKLSIPPRLEELRRPDRGDSAAAREPARRAARERVAQTP